MEELECCRIYLILWGRRSEMPNSLQLAVVSEVLPYSLCSSFTENRTWLLNKSDPYPDGSLQMKVLVSQPRRSWTLSKKLRFDDYDALKSFYEDRKGGFEPFYVYFNKAEHDPTGESLTGRYTVRFEGNFSSTYDQAFYNTQISLIEIA